MWISVNNLRIMSDNRKKFSKTYDKYVEKIYRYIFLKVDSSDTAQDLTSQVFTKAWARVKDSGNGTSGQGQEIENLPAYIYQIARAEISNLYRDKAKYKIISTDASLIADPQVNLEEAQQKQMEVSNLRQCLTQLDDESQNIIIWHYLDEMPYKEISKILDKPENTIRVIAHRAIKELKNKIVF